MSYGDEDSDSDSDSSGRNRRRNKPPRFVKHNLDEVELGVIMLNTYRSQYQILDEMAAQFGWLSEKDSKSEVWDILWTDSEIQVDDLFKMHQYQKVSHFPGINVLARKNSLGKALMKLRKQFPQEYNFFPLTWSLPSEFSQLVMFTNSQEPKNPIFIVKPQASCQGKGIFLTKSIKQLQGCTYVVQQYLQNPLLITKLKFDFRLYVLVLGCDPLRVYIHEEGLARFATEPYKHPKQKNLKSACVHLTNYSLNKKNPNFVFNTSEEKMDVGHKRSFSSILLYLEKNGVDIKSMKRKINDLVVKTLISAQPFLSHIYRLSQPNNLSNDMCFQILGFDIILDDNHDPYLLQVNHNPSLIADTPLDKFIKKKLVKDTFNILNINIKNKQEKILKKKKERSDRQNGIKSKKLELLEKKLLKKQFQAIRDEYQDANLGGFTKIYPVRQESQTKKYDSFLEKSQGLFQEVSGIRYDFQSQSLSLKKYQKRMSMESKSAKQKAKKSLSVKTTPRRSLNSSKITHQSDTAKLLPVLPFAKHNQKSRFPTIQKGKFVVPQTFNLRDWGAESETRVPVYLRDFLSNKDERRKPSSRHREIRRRG